MVAKRRGGTYVHTVQWIFGYFLDTWDHNIQCYVLNPVLNYKGHWFLPLRSRKVKLTFFISEIEVSNCQDLGRRSQYFTLYPISLHDIENIYVKVKIWWLASIVINKSNLFFDKTFKELTRCDVLNSKSHATKKKNMCFFSKF